jgi:hypothetical protein
MVSQQDEEEAADDDAEEELTPEQVAMVKTYVEAGVFLLLLACLLWGLYSGSKKGTEIFEMADVNFLFTAPIKPQSVLLFRLSFQMAATILGSVYLVFQIPNLVLNAGLGWEAVAALFVGWILFCILQKLTMVLSYTVFATHEKWKRYLLPMIFAFVAVIALAFAAVYFSTGRAFYRTVQLTFASRWARGIPILGWYKGMILCAINGQNPAFAGYFLLLLVGIGIFVFLIWQIKADFYEDALVSANRSAELLDAVQEGRTPERAKERSGKIRRTGSFGGSGASVFFTKEIYCRRRMARWGFVTNTMLFYLAVCAIGGFVTARVFDDTSFFVTGMILTVILFFRNLGNPIAQETSMNWLFLVPDNPYKKVFYAMLAGTCGCAMDLLPGLIAAALLLGADPFSMLLWFLTLVIVDFMLSCAGLLLEALCPSSALNELKSLIRMFLRIAMIAVLVLFLAIGYLIGGETVALVYTMIASMAVGGGIFCIYPSLLHEGRRE